MSANEYQFVTCWRVEGTCGEVADIIGDPMALTRWWPAVYLDVEELRPGGNRGIGKRVRLHTKGWLPYTLAWDLEVVDSRYPHGLTIVASGDFEGTGIWTFEQNGAFVNAIHEWRIRAEKPLLRGFSVVLKPIFEANHRWAMAQGKESLELELARRRAISESARSAVPPPPGPVTYAGVALLAGVAVAAVGAAWLVTRAVRHSRRQARGQASAID